MAACANDWQPPAAYLYALTLDGPALAWEYLRRNPRYRATYRRHARGGPGKAGRAEAHHAAPWGLRLLEDPTRDARHAQPVWQPDPDSLPQLHPDPAIPSAPPDAPTFALWRVPGHKQLTHDGRRLVLTAHLPGGALRLALSPQLGHGMAYAYAVPAGARWYQRWCAAAATLARFDRIRAAQPHVQADAHTHAHTHDRPNRVALLHMRSLQALDGRAAGASQRQIAQALFGADAVAARWHGDGELRAQVRRLVLRGQALVNGGYRRLLQDAA